MKKLNIGVLASTKATDLQAVIDEINAGKLEANIAVLISDKADAYCMERARNNNIEAFFINPKGKTREQFDTEAISILEKHNVDLVLLIGYMRFLSPIFVEKYRNKIMNIHPSLLPAFAGGMDKNVHQEILNHGVKITGCTLHFVDEGADTGPIIMQKAVVVSENETVDSLKEKVQKMEQEIIIEAIKLFAEERLKVDGRMVRIEGYP